MSHDQLTISMILVHFLSLEKAVWFFASVKHKIITKSTPAQFIIDLNLKPVKINNKSSYFIREVCVSTVVSREKSNFLDGLKLY